MGTFVGPTFIEPIFCPLGATGEQAAEELVRATGDNVRAVETIKVNKARRIFEENKLLFFTEIPFYDATQI